MSRGRRAQGSCSRRLERAAARECDFRAVDGGGDLPANGGLEEAADGGGLHGLMAIRLTALAVIPSNSHADLQWAKTG